MAETSQDYIAKNKMLAAEIEIGSEGDSIPEASQVPTEATQISMDGDIVLDAKCFVHRSQWVPQRERKACLICTRAFGTFRRKHSCRMCGEVVCSKCSLFKRVHVHIGENKVRICSGCYLSYRKNMESLSTGSSEAPIAKIISPRADSSSASGGEKANSGAVSAALRAAMAATETARRGEESRKEAIQEKDFASKRAEVLEEEVKRSKGRVKELETLVFRVKEQQSSQDLSAEQKKELKEAKLQISTLQEKLRLQEVLAKEGNGNINSFEDDDRDSADDVASKLRKRLQKMERQIIQAGLNVVEDIPFKEAKAKVKEISERMHEIGSSEVTHENKDIQNALRKEYFVLEQEMEKYNTALIMTDEYIAEQKRLEEKWNDENEVLNSIALEKVRSCIPINISQLSEKSLTELITPSGVELSRTLARRLKRTNILEFLRMEPESLIRMHPSCIDRYRLTGLSLLERRALHLALRAPYDEWKLRKNEEFAQRKYAWYRKLELNLKSSVRTYNAHCERYGSEDNHKCDLLGKQCPVVAENEILKLYESLGFPSGEVFLKNEVLKSDPDGAGEKALAEAKAHANSMIANQRMQMLKAHYGMNLRDISKAAGFLEELDDLLDYFNDSEDAWALSHEKRGSVVNIPWESEINSYSTLIQDSKSLILKIGERSGLSFTGKRDPSKDGEDTRALVEIEASINVAGFLVEILTDMSKRISDFGECRAYRSLTTAVQTLMELVREIQKRNGLTYSKLNPNLSYEAVFKRPSWSKRCKDAKARIASPDLSVDNSTTAFNSNDETFVKNPQMSNLLKSISHPTLENISKDGKKAPVDMLAAIRARKNKTASCPNILGESANAPRKNALLSAIKQRGDSASAPGKNALLSVIKQRGNSANASGNNALLSAIKQRGELNKHKVANTA